MSAFRLACLQTAGNPESPEANLAELETTAREAAGLGADLLVTPEMFLTGYDIGDLAAELAGEPLLNRVAAVAKRTGTALLAGLPLWTGDGLVNAAAFVSDTGEVLGVHAKTHLFGELDRQRFTAGNTTTTIVEYRGLRVAMLICYDVEFPENARAAAQCGAHLIAVPTAQMTPFEWVAETVIPVRAWENQVYVCYVNLVGTERATTYVGRSSVVAPDGSVLASAGRSRELLVADLDRHRVEAARRENPYLDDLRTDLRPPRTTGPTPDEREATR